MTERQPKMRQHNMQSLSGTMPQQIAKSAKSVSTDHCRSVRCGIVWPLVVRRTNFPGTIHSPRSNERDFRLTTPSEYLAAHPTQQIVEPAASTWGENGHLAVWLDPSNAWIYPQLNPRRTHDSARAAAPNCCRAPQSVAGRRNGRRSACPTMTDRVLKQLARELLLAQSSDWAFLMKTGTAREYATQRTIDHLARFNRLHDQFVTNNLDEEFLRDCEWRTTFFRT
jgi:1,4-alpha-glucan branching enzyme